MLQLILAAVLTIASHLHLLLTVPQVQERTAPNALRTELTLEEINQRSTNAKAVVDLEEKRGSAIQQLYERSRQQLEATKKAEADLQRFQEMVRNAAEQLAALKKELASDSASDALLIKPDASESTLQELLGQLNIKLSNARENAKAAANEVARRQTRQLVITDLLNSAAKRLDEIGVQLNAEVPAGESPVLTQARMTQLTAEQQNLETQVQALKAEQAAYLATADFPPIQDQLAKRATKQLEADIAAVNARIAELRETEIQKLRRDAEKLKRVTAKNCPELIPLAETNIELVNELETLSTRIAQVNQTQQQIEKSRAWLNKRYETTQERVAAIGLNDTLGIMLRQSRADVEKLRVKFRVDSSLREEVSSIRADSYRSTDRMEDLEDLEAATLEYVAELELTESRKKEILDELTILLAAKKDLLSRLAELQLDSFNALFGLLSEQRRLASLCTEYNSYIDQRVLWIRSAKVLNPADINTMLSASREFTVQENWRSVGQSLVLGMRERMSMLLIIGSGLVLLFLFQGRLRKNIAQTAKLTSRRSCREFTPSATTLLETILISSLWPIVIMTIGWLLRADIMAANFTHALGGGLIAVGLAVAPLEFFRQLTRKDGLADAHFDWPPSNRKTLHSNLRWLLILGSPLLLVTVTLNHLGNEEWNNTLGRASAIGLMLLATIFVYQVLRLGGRCF